jgi:dipeptidyl-peptidase-4
MKFFAICLVALTTPLTLAVTDARAQDSKPEAKQVTQGAKEVAQGAAKEVVVPPLSLETIFHPERKFAYLSSPAPGTRWIKDEGGEDRLLIKREAGWMVIDPQTAIGAAGDKIEETPWGGRKALIDQLLAFGDIEPKRAEGVVDGWIGDESRSLDSAILRLDHRIVLAGLRQTPRTISQQAGAWQEPVLSPDGSRVAFVQDNDLHVLHLASGELLRVTDDGGPARLNGRLDWVYQEELYGRGNFRAFWWSPDSRRIALLRLDNDHVTPYTITTSDKPRGGVMVDRYPKAGDPITHAELWLATLGEGGPAVSLSPVYAPPRDEERLIVRVSWNEGTGDLLFQVTNRLQNELVLYRLDPHGVANAAPVPLVRESCDQWLEVIDVPRWLPSGDCLWLSDLPSGRRRLWLVSGDGGLRVPITPDGFDVRELVAVDPLGKTALILGDVERGAAGQQLYRVTIGPTATQEGASVLPAENIESIGKPDGMLERLTDVMPWHQVSVSPSQKWFVDRASGLVTPTRLSLAAIPARQVHAGEGRPGESTAAVGDADAKGVTKLLHAESIKLPGPPTDPRWVTIDTPDGVKLPGYYIRPQGKETSAAGAGSGTEPGAGGEAKPKHPVLIEVYGGPLAPSARDSWATSRFLFHQYLAEQGIGVMVVDTRSSGGRGLADAWSIHRRVGELETKDVVAAADWLRGQDWVDPQKVAIRGWSFGGFLTLHAMTHSDRFAAGVAGGSVTDWRNYDAIYTERYMGLPADNTQGYDATSPVLAAKELKGDVLLIHGEVDDNVHLANTMQMIAALQRHGKPLELMIYPGSAHGVAPGMPNYHLMRTTVDFLMRKLR